MVLDEQHRQPLLLPQPPDDAEDLLDEQRRQVSEAAVELLTARQQRIIQMSFEGWSVHDIASELKLAPERVSDEKYKAIRKLRSHLAEADRDDSAARLTA